MDATNYTMQNAANAYYSGNRYVDQTRYQRSYGLGWTPNDEQMQSLAMSAYKPKGRVGGMSLVPSLSTPEASVYIRPGSKTLIVAFRGTVPSNAGDIATDVALSQGNLRSTARFRRSENHLQSLAAQFPGYNIQVTGHSLGSALAKAVSGNDRVSRGVGFNTGYAAPWSQGAIRNWRSRPQSADYKFSDYLNKNDLVSAGALYGGVRGRHTWYANSWGLGAHKPKYWGS